MSHLYAINSHGHEAPIRDDKMAIKEGYKMAAWRGPNDRVPVHNFSPIIIA